MENPILSVTLLRGDCREKLKELPDCSVDSIVTDPPAGIGFMGMDWDKDKGGRDQWIAWMTEIAAECLRVLKPGGHALVWAIPRTSHWTATAWENAGFEVRDRVVHVFGSGFPKSLGISMALDKMAGAKRDVIGQRAGTGSKAMCGRENGKGLGTVVDITEPATDAAKQWNGWGTALKPAMEDWWLLRKPLIGTVAQNVLAHGVGGLNIDACRVGDAVRHASYTSFAPCHGNSLGAPGSSEARRGTVAGSKNYVGRWPANLVLSYPEDEYQLRDDVTPAQLRDLAEWLDGNT